MATKDLSEQFQYSSDRYIAEKRATLQPFLDMDPSKASLDDLKNAVININKHLPDILAKQEAFRTHNYKATQKFGLKHAAFLSKRLADTITQKLHRDRNDRFAEFCKEVQEKRETLKKAGLQKINGSPHDKSQKQTIEKPKRG